jgi:hypothetical protein
LQFFAIFSYQPISFAFDTKTPYDCSMAKAIPRAKALQAALQYCFRPDIADVERLVALSRVTVLDPGLSFIDQIDPNLHVYQDVEEWRSRVARLANMIEDRDARIKDLERQVRRSQKKSKTKTPEPAEEPNFNWTPELHSIATTVFLSGGGPTEVANNVGCNVNQARSMLYNKRLKFPLRVGKGNDPLTWEEIWQIGSCIYGQGWNEKIVNDLKIPWQPPKPINVNRALIDGFRAKYREWEFIASEKAAKTEKRLQTKREKKGEKVARVLEIIKKHAGITTSDIASILDIKPREARRWAEQLVVRHEVKTHIDNLRAQRYTAVV